jgi:hypothetical protein
VTSYLYYYLGGGAVVLGIVIAVVWRVRKCFGCNNSPCGDCTACLNNAQVNEGYNSANRSIDQYTKNFGFNGGRSGGQVQSSGRR